LDLPNEVGQVKVACLAVKKRATFPWGPDPPALLDYQTCRINILQIRITERGAYSRWRKTEDSGEPGSEDTHMTKARRAGGGRPPRSVTVVLDLNSVLTLKQWFAVLTVVGRFENVLKLYQCFGALTEF